MTAITTTPEENEDEIAKLESQIDEAAKKRDYVRADQLQTRLDYCLQVRAAFAKQKRADNKRAELERLENEQRREERELKQRMERKMEKLLDEADRRYQQIEQRRKDEIERLDTRFSDPRFSALRMSSDVKIMLRQERYYVRQRNYKVANAIKNQITARTQAEMALNDANATQTVDAAIEGVERRFDQEKRGFHLKLEDDKIKLNREAARELQALHNKYLKLRNRILDIGEENRSPVGSGRIVTDAIEGGFNEYYSTIGCAPSSPRSPRTVRGVRASQGSMRSTARNPRVARALERSMMRRDKLSSTL